MQFKFNILNEEKVDHMVSSLGGWIYISQLPGIFIKSATCI